MAKLRVLDLFSGIGGFSLGLERATMEGAEYDGFETVAFCEIEDFPRRVLAKHWPDVPCYDDVRTLTGERLAADGIAVDVICGGFPCQDISFAGLGAGLAGERSGLFYEIARLIGELGPRFIILENVGALLSRGLDAVLGTLASLGYDAEWHCIPASAVGAPHRRDRIWIVAYPHSFDDAAGLGAGTDPRAARAGQGGNGGKGQTPFGERLWAKSSECCEVLAHPTSERLPRPWQPIIGRGASAQGEGQAAWPLASGLGDIWRAEPDVGRVANGVPDRAHRLKALGNAIVPQIAELLGHAILQSERRAS